MKIGKHGPIVSPLIGITITCNNSDNRSAPIVVDLDTAILGGSITLNNSGSLQGFTNGILVDTLLGFSPISITNSGNVASNGTGISANALFSKVTIVNSGNIAAAGLGTFGIFSFAGLGNLSVTNSGDIATAGLGTSGIFANAAVGDLLVQNSGDIATAGAGVFGISAAAGLGDITLKNSGNIAVAGAGVFGISAAAGTGDINLQNSGQIAAAGAGVFGIAAITATSDVTVGNKGSVSVSGDSARALFASAGDDLNLNNNGKLSVKGSNAFGIAGSASDNVSITNGGNISANGGSVTAIAAAAGDDLQLSNSGDLLVKGNSADGIAAVAIDDVTVINSGKVSVSGNQASGIAVLSNTGKLSLTNKGAVSVTGSNAVGLVATSGGAQQLSVINSGDVTATSQGISVVAANTGLVNNLGTVSGGEVGITAGAGNQLTILNSGTVSAGSNLAIQAGAQTVDVVNTGTVIGSVDLAGTTKFDNQSGGLFEALSSEFGNGSFINEAGGVVHTARTPGLNEVVTFTGLRSFSNAGTISLVDHDPNDVFEIAPFGNGQSYTGKGKGAVAVDVFLGGPGSPADNVFINADVKGKTALVVNNTNPGNGATNKEGIPVVFVEGSVAGNQFYLKDGPIDAGLVAYDLFFTKTGSGFFELRTIPDGHTGSFLLPELTTASQDVFFTTSETWFDRTADLRVLLAGGGPGVQPVTNPADADSNEGLSFNPAIWARGGGAVLNQGDTAGATAYGRSYNFNLNRDLEIMNFESGIDLGKRDFLTDGDILVFGVLGGAIQASLDYDNILRQFSYDGGEVGVYATYLHGGLFVDTLAKADLLTIDPRDVRGFPDTLDDTNLGGRVDAGYRFGGFSGGPFVEPLATIAFAWANVEGFTKDGNTVEFEDETNVRGRLGLRVGTSVEAWEGATFEPFVIGSVWSTLGGTNSATLTSLGTTFPTFSDESTDVWGEVSAGVNFFVPNKQTSVFAKVDVSFGEDLDGIGGKAGMRYNW